VRKCSGRRTIHREREREKKTHLVVSHDVGGVVGDSLGDAKVDQLQAALNAYKIGWLEIAVDHSLLVNRVHGFQHLALFAHHIEKKISKKRILKRLSLGLWTSFVPVARTSALSSSKRMTEADYWASAVHSLSTLLKNNGECAAP
jgi:hypothetical protein